MAYTPIRISTVRPNETLSFDLYIYFKERYLRYVDREKQLSNDLLDKLKKQKVAKFYIMDTDEEKYQVFLDKIFDQLMDDPNTTVNEKVSFVEGASVTALEKIQSDPTSSTSFNMTKKAAKNLRQMINAQPDALKELFGRKAAENEKLMKHSLNVSALCTRLAESLTLSEDDIDNIGVAGLLHDIGIARYEGDDLKLFNQKPEQLSAEKLKLYQNHTNAAIKLLEQNPLVNQVIIKLVLNHEEKISGKGYPNQISKLDQLEEILSLVNAYDKNVTVYEIPPKDTLKFLKVDELGNYSMSLINKFKEVLKRDGLTDI